MPRRILVVDDNSINRQLLIFALSKDYEIIEAENGKSALEMMHKNYRMLSAVLMDIAMPEMDGYEVLRRVRENAVLSQLPIIIITGSEDEESRVKALSLGANDFILKPFNPDIVRHILRNNIAMRETASILNAIQRDKLTGLFNREAFFNKAEAMIQEKEPGYFILSSFDIDNFKLINDQYGAPEGNRILKEIAVALRSNMDMVGGLAGRISADNYVALFPTAVGETEILKRIQNKTLVQIGKQNITFSVGRYLIMEPNLPASSIYDRAYLAKQTIKNRFDTHMAYFDAEMLRKLMQDQQIATNMETALTSNQFEVWFQPQYNHETGALIGAEALVRWRHPEKGIISPGVFIPLFEQNGFIYELDKYVWRETCRYLQLWTAEGLTPPPVSVNISRYDVFREDLVEVITGLLKEYSIPVELLSLEITESAFSKSTKIIVDIVKKFISLGFTVEIDDFGSGYSSLNTLKEVPAQVVKLDMRFLEGGEDTQRGGNILESIVRMTKWLGMAVIAEGVETTAQGDFLKSIGCSQVQGYLYARPMTADKYEGLLKEAKREERHPVLETADHLNNDLFWDPNSMDSLIFNSYVGAACIYEYSNTSIELLRATDKFAKMLGKNMTVEKLMRLPIVDYFEKQPSSGLAEEFQEFLQGSGEITMELKLINLPECQTEIFIRSHMRVIAKTDNRYLIYCINENITMQKLSERKERQKDIQLHSVLENVNCGICATKREAEKVKFLFANAMYFNIYGYTSEKFEKEIGSDIYSTICHEDREFVRNAYHQVRSFHEPLTIEYRIISRNGKTLWIRSHLSETFFEGEEKPVTLSTLTDITTERQTAQELLDNLPCGAGICLLTDSEAKMVYLNKKYFSYFQDGIGTRRTSSVYDVIHKEDRSVLLNTIMDSVRRGKDGTCEVRILDGVDESGKEVYRKFRLIGSALKDDKEHTSIYVIFIPLD